MSDSSAADRVFAYHRRTKHRFDAYAPGPPALDWNAQPAPFRHFAGAPILELPLACALGYGRDRQFMESHPYGIKNERIRDWIVGRMNSPWRMR